MTTHDSSPKVPGSPQRQLCNTSERVGVRELVACFERLEAHDDSSRREIAAFLSREWHPRRMPAPVPGETILQPPPVPPPAKPFVGPPEEPKPDDPAPLPGPPQLSSGMGGLDNLGAAPVLMPELSWLPLSDERTPPPSTTSLHRVQERRALYKVSLETPQRGDRPDVSRIVEALTTGRPLLELPMRSWPSLTRGAQVMVDLAPPLWGFFHDQEEVIETLRPVVGPLLERLHFSSDPFLAGAGSSFEWRTYQPPAPRTPVLILSELGQLGGGEQAHLAARRWLRFSRVLAWQGSPCVVLTPLRPSNFHIVLRRHFVLLEWDRTTRVPIARRARRGGGKYADR